MLGGFEYITRVQMYWRIFEDRETHESIHPDIYKSLTGLYSCIVEYQARVICHLSSAQLTRTWEKMTDVNDWEGRKHRIEELDAHCGRLVSEVEQTRIGKVRDLQLKEMHESRSILEHIRRGLKDLESQTQRRHDDNKETALLGNLSADYENHKNINPLRVPGTCEWLLNDDDFRQWRDSTSSNLLWISAGPGCGKSVLTRSLVDESQLSTSVTTSQTCYFFFNRGNADQVDSTNALSAMLHQLLIQDSTGDLMKLALASHKSHGQGLKRNFAELWRILLACASSESSGEIICVFDALDECDEQSRDQLLQAFKSFLDNKARRSRLKIVITSRPYDDIEAAFHNFPSRPVFVHVDGDDKSHDIGQEINIVIDLKVQEFARDFSEEHRCMLSERLKAMDNRTYLWLHLTFDIIKRKRSIFSKSSRIQDLLNSIPSRVSDAYEDILNHNEDDHDTTRILLEIILAARRPLTLEEANYALTLAISKGDFDEHESLEGDLWPMETFKMVVKNLSGLFINVYDSKLFFIHLTAREFLTDLKTKKYWHGSFCNENAHATASSICIRYLSVVGVDILSRDLEDIEQRYPFVPYTTLNWSVHYNSQHENGRIELCDSARNLCRASGKRGWQLAARYCQSETWMSFDRKPEFNDLELASVLGIDPVVTRIVEDRLKDAKGIDEDYGVSLEMAAEEGYPEVIRILLKSKTNVETHAQHENEAFARAIHKGHVDVMAVLLDAIQNLRLDYHLLLMVLGMGKGATLSLLLERMGDQIHLDEDMIEMAAQNFGYGVEVMDLLLQKRGNEVAMTESVLTGAAGNSRCAKEVMALLLSKRGDEIEITEEVMNEAAKNRTCGVGIVKLLLDRRGDDIVLTEQNLVYGAGNTGSGDQVMQLLLKASKGLVPLSDAIIAKAVKNGVYGDSIVKILLEMRPDEFQVKSEMLVLAAENPGCPKEVLELLFKVSSEYFPLNPEMVAAAAQTYSIGIATIEYFVKTRGDEIQACVTESALVAAAKNQDKPLEMMKLLLELGVVDATLVTDKVVAAAAGHESAALQLVELLLDNQEADVRITEAVMKSAVKNPRLGTELTTLLWGKRRDEVRACITDEVLAIAEKNYSNRNVLPPLLREIRSDDGVATVLPTDS